MTMSRDARLLDAVRAVCAHVASTIEMSPAAADELCGRVAASVGAAVAFGGATPVVLGFHSTGSELTVDVAGQVLRQSLPA
jgi:hypothetical protein